MRNIVSIDTTYNPIDLSYTNCDCETNSIQLEIQIDENLTNVVLHIVKNSVTTIVNNLNIINNIIKYDLVSSNFLNSGNVQVKVIGYIDNQTSQQVANIVFEVPNNYLNTDSIIVKISNDTYIIKKVESNKYSDLPIATTTSLGVVKIGSGLNIDSSGLLRLNSYPVGSIIMSDVITNPSEYIGGTWIRLEGFFPYAASNSSPGDTGGSNDVTLTVNQIPSHMHNIGDEGAILYGGQSVHFQSGWSTAYLNSWHKETAHGHTNYTGGGQSHSNLPQYRSTYFFKRTA